MKRFYLLFYDFFINYVQVVSFVLLIVAIFETVIDTAKFEWAK